MRLNEGEVLIEEITSEDLGGRMIIDFFERLPNVFLPVCGVAPVMTEAMMVRICPHKARHWPPCMRIGMKPPRNIWTSCRPSNGTTIYNTCSIVW